MTDKELRAIDKRDLLKQITDKDSEITRLRGELSELQKIAAEKKLPAESAGSLAEAALEMSNVFAAAQESADLYLAGIREMETKSKSDAADIIANAQKKAAEIIAEAEQKCSEREAAEARYIDGLWVDLHDKLMQFYQSYSELGELVRQTNILPSISKPEK